MKGLRVGIRRTAARVCRQRGRLREIGRLSGTEIARRKSARRKSGKGESGKRESAGREDRQKEKRREELSQPKPSYGGVPDTGKEKPEGEKGVYPDHIASLKLPRQCNQCRQAPCEQVCPVGATYYSPEGVVLIHTDRCIGCRFCMAACPYDARFINPKTNSAEKCTFCYHRLQVGLLPACVSTCIGNARLFGDLSDPESAVAKALSEFPTDVLRPEMKTGPHVYYIGLDNKLSVLDYSRLSKKKG
ncbi:tetrathionate reductase subunit B precursor [Peptococcaceae bacterium CEB3]|nr:tetrathionate reductase subunit B precursor [Peptococcaceae bacterium CEB3]